MEKNPLEKLKFNFLSPDYRIIHKVGSTGSGKTYSDLMFTTPDAFNVLSNSVGEGSGTLKDQTKIYTEKLKNHIIVAAKQNEEIYKWAQLIEMLLKVYTKIVKTNYKDSQMADQGQVRNNLVRELLEALNSNRNIEAQPRILSERQRNEIADKIAECSMPFFHKNLQVIFQEAKNKLRESEAKPNSRKMDEAINQRLQETIDNEPEFVNELREFHRSINESLRDYFFQYFDEDKLSDDKYYYRIIDLNNLKESDDFIKSLFTNNDLVNGNRLSIEVLCTELIIYAPMNDEVKQFISSNSEMACIFEGMDGKISLGIRDTRGMYHESADQKKETEYLQELLYDRSYDALMLVCPAFSDNNHAKLREDVKAVLNHYSKQTPIILLINKVDLLIDDQYKGSNNVNLFTMNIFPQPEEIPFEDLELKINQRVNSIYQEFLEAQQKRNGGVLVSVPCFLKPPNTTKMTNILYEAYGPRQALHTILKTLTDSLATSSEKIPFHLTDELDGKLPFRVNRKRVNQSIAEALIDAKSVKKVLQPALKNINDNLGKKPHGQGYNALGYYRLPRGYGWTSNIDEGYFVNCESFSIDFPANVINLITPELLKEIISYSVDYPKGYFETPEGLVKLNKIVRNTFRPNIFAANLLYDNAFKRADNAGFSYKYRFNQFLKICTDYFKFSDEIITSGQISSENDALNAYTEAMVKELKHALKLAFRLRVYLN